MNKKIILPILIIFLSLVGGAYVLGSSNQAVSPLTQSEASGLRKADLQIEGMFCLGCRASVVNSVLTFDGVIQADADPGTDTGWVVYDPEIISVDQILTATVFTAYPVTLISDRPYEGGVYAGDKPTEIPLDLQTKIDSFAQLLVDKGVKFESFFQDELDEAIRQGDWDKANNLLDNYIQVYDKN